MTKIPDIRFKGNQEEWFFRRFDTILKYEQPNRYIVNNVEYDDKYDIPVLTAGLSFILGYTNELNNVKMASSSCPVIIFDDFTTSSHYVNFPFKIKSSAIKLLTLVNANIDDIYFINLVLENISYVPISHERHWISMFSKFNVLVPLSNEQNKIGNYFKCLDKTITTCENKIEQLKLLKDAMLHKMFPLENETKPQIRFSEYTNAWEQRKFGDIGTVSMCKRIFKNETSDKGEIPFYKIGTFGGEPDAYISRELFEEYKGKFSYPNKGDILLSASGTIGRIVEYDGEEAYFQDSNIVWLSHDESVCNKFLKVLYPVIRWDGIEGSTIQRLYNDNFLKTRFMMPSVEEQEKIGEYFSRLDNLITLHQRKLEKLKQIKKALLNKMFV